jgi:hypothetical protein
MDYHEAVESELGFVCHPKNSLSNASRWGETTGDLPKNCHLLPSTAILEAQNRYDRFNSFIDQAERIQGCQTRSLVSLCSLSCPSSRRFVSMGRPSITCRH